MDPAAPEYPLFIERLIARSDLVAHVKVLKIPFWSKKVVRVEYLEIFKGTKPEHNKVHVPTMWGKYDYDWYKNDEESVLFAWGPEVIGMGPVGRMPIMAFEGELYAESFAEDIDALAGLNPIRSYGRLLVKWSVLRAFLLEHSKL